MSSTVSTQQPSAESRPPDAPVEDRTVVQTAITEATQSESAGNEPTTIEKLRGLPWSIFSNATNTVFAQFTFFGSVFVLFLSDLGMDKARIGFLLSLIPFAGLVALFIAPAVARFGYKRTYIIFYGLRKVITAGLLLTPVVAATWGSQGLALYVTLITGGFALARAIAEVGVYPWLQEYIPNSVRGRYSATNSIYTTLVGLASVGMAGYVLDRSSGLSGYMLLIGVGVVFGFVSVWAATKIPGGAPVRKSSRDPSTLAGMAEAARDGNFLRYLSGAALITIGIAPMVSFLPLFMQEQIGLGAGAIVWLQAGTLVGNLVSSFPWGWASDRYGSKPVMLSGLALKIVLPVLWFTMPRGSETSLYVALGIAVLLGVSDMAWAIGAGRLLFVSVVPPAKKMPYMALHYAWVGIIGGLSQLLGGYLLDLSSGLEGEWFGLAIDPYTPLFALGFLLTIVATLLLEGMRADNIYGVGQFAGLFFRGNPFQAVGALVRYYQAKDERAAVAMTERLGQAKSPLTVEELLETLRDPRFNVRMEAIISIARMPPDRRLTAALVEILRGTELALQAVAAWALGRIGDEQALPPLREALNSPYHSIRAQSARALGALRDRTVIPELLARLETETDKGLQMAYASALGNLRATEAVGPLLALLEKTQNPGARLELALSLARISGNEHIFINLLRQMRADPATAAAQAVDDLRRRLERNKHMARAALPHLAEASNAFAHGSMEQGISHLAAGVGEIPAEMIREPGRTILLACLIQLQATGIAHQEYLLLALHVLEVAV
ncbi:MAG TPA: MFS transporter [Caldilineaceae bacterium]|nr:MFS transporter [Caldilineaceae bacterium]